MNLTLSAITAICLTGSTFINADCFDVFPHIPDQSISVILSDLPYQVTQNSWDSCLPLDRLFAEYKRVLKDGGAIVLTAQQPFSSELVMANRIGYKCEWVWRKNNSTGFLNAKKHPLRTHESVLVFAKDKGGLKTYNPQFTSGKPYTAKIIGGKTKNYGKQSELVVVVNDGSKYYPTTVLDFDVARKTQHPTEKPVKLFEYFLLTYSDESAIVLDNCAGVATTAIAAINTGRRYICIEKEKTYFDIGVERINKILGI